MPFIGHITSWRSRAAILVAGLALAAPVNALIFTVDSTIDAIDSTLGDGFCDDGSGRCTLRAAIQEANNLGGSHTIELQPGTYRLSLSGSGEDLAVSGDLDINADITIQPVGVADARSVIINGGGIDRVFHVLSGSTTITGVTIRQGNIQSAHGGAIRNSATLTLSDCTLTANTAGSNDGGAIYNGGTLALERCTVNANSAGQGGAIFNIGSVAVTNSTISGNSATTLGGGFYNDTGATLTLSHVTVYGNSAPTDGGGIYNSGSATVDSTILNANTDNNCFGTVISTGHSIDSALSCGFGTGGTDLEETDPKLGVLADNGGPTLTHALADDSPAIDAGDNVNCPPPSTDQRGVPRPVDGGIGAICDIGAYEWTEAVSLAIANNQNDDCPDLGDTVKYTLTANNLGTVDATGVKIIDTLPTEMTFVSVAPSADCTRHERTVLCDIGSFVPGSTRTFTITMTVDATNSQAAIKTNSATIYAIENDVDIDDNTSNEYTTVDCSDCFIATAAFGGTKALEVGYLRALRDDYLNTNTVGREFIKLYYFYSPPVADFLRRHDGLRAAVRVGLMPLVALSKTLARAGKGA